MKVINNLGLSLVEAIFAVMILGVASQIILDSFTLNYAPNSFNNSLMLAAKDQTNNLLDYYVMSIAKLNPKEKPLKLEVSHSKLTSSVNIANPSLIKLKNLGIDDARVAKVYKVSVKSSAIKKPFCSNTASSLVFYLDK